jgi:hypothetical protein
MTQVKQSIWNFARQYPVLVLFVASYTVVHLTFEYSFWLTNGESIFGKYADATTGNALRIAQKVYFAKATWMFAFVWLLVLRFSLRTAITYSFLLYSIELLFFFEVRLYAVLNLLLAIGLLIELWMKPTSNVEPAS